MFVQNFNGVSMLPEAHWSVPDAILATDACPTGCGTVSPSQYFHTEFPNFILALGLSIYPLELLTIVVAVKLWREELSGKCILIFL